MGSCHPPLIATGLKVSSQDRSQSIKQNGMTLFVVPFDPVAQRHPPVGLDRDDPTTVPRVSRVTVILPPGRLPSGTSWANARRSAGPEHSHGPGRCYLGYGISA